MVGEGEIGEKWMLRGGSKDVPIGLLLLCDYMRQHCTFSTGASLCTCQLQTIGEHAPYKYKPKND